VDPSSGSVAVDAYQALEISLNADRLGWFEELITIHVEGSSNDIVLKLRYMRVRTLLHQIITLLFRVVTTVLFSALSVSFFVGF